MTPQIHTDSALVNRACPNHYLIKNKIRGDICSATPGARREIDNNSFWTRDSFELDEFLQYHGAEFLNNAYRAIFRRFPDHAGFTHYESILKAGISREKIVGILRYSNEGESTSVKIKGLKPRFFYKTTYGPRMIIKRLLNKVRPGKPPLGSSNE
jgi:hypothetical protein